MEFCTITYVVIPKGYDFEKHISILESTGINVDIETARAILKQATEEWGAHCQDYDCSYNADIEDGYEFAVRVLKDLGMVLYEYNTGQSGNANIRNVSEFIISQKEMILKVLNE